MKNRWATSTLGEDAWQRARHGGQRWAIGGAVLGALLAALAFWPAAWLAAAVAERSGGRLLLADARGTVWNGSATLVLSAGPGSRDASALPGRLGWQVGLAGAALELRLTQACCIRGTQSVLLRPGFGRFALELRPGNDWVAQWPTAWLTGLGTPFNTLDLGGMLRLTSSGMTVASVQGRWRLDGQAALELRGVSSRLTPLPALGSYTLSLAEDAAGGAALALATQEGALLLSGSGAFGATGLRFRGEARAAPGQEAVLNNLLNIIGRRDGERSVISIG